MAASRKWKQNMAGSRKIVNRGGPMSCGPFGFFETFELKRRTR
jgi:hypothetical protein